MRSGNGAGCRLGGHVEENRTCVFSKARKVDVQVDGQLCGCSGLLQNK